MNRNADSSTQRSRTFLTALALLISIALNVVIGYSISNPTLPGSSLQATDQFPDNRSETNQLDSTNVPVTPVAPERFTWKMLYAEDLQTYKSRLRDVGCPEDTVRDILIGEIELRSRQKLESGSAPTTFWRSAAQMRRALRDARRKQEQLRDQERALIEEILGIKWDRIGYEAFLSSPSDELQLGFLPQDRAILLLGRRIHLAELYQQLAKETDGILLPEDKQELVSALNQFQALLGSGEWEEARLREWDSMQHPNDYGRPLGVVPLAGFEYREIQRLESGGLNPLATYLGRSENDNLNEAKSSARLDAQPAVSNLLGATRYKAYARSQNPTFKETYIALAQGSSGSEMSSNLTAAVGVFNCRQQFNLAMANLYQQSNLSTGELASATVQLRREFENTVHTLVGDQAFGLIKDRQVLTLTDDHLP